MKLLCAFIFIFLTNFGLAEEIFDETGVEEILREVIYEENTNDTSVRLIENWQESAENEELGFAGGMVSQRCLSCICKMESGCRNVGCKMDMGSLSCGYFQIKEAYWIDCGRPGSSWKSCAASSHCASLCVQKYMKRYARWAGCPLRCEGFAREHNGGPRGCKRSSTIGYWKRLQNISGCHGVR